MLSKPRASVGNEHPPFSPSNNNHSSGNHGPSEVVTYQILFTSSQRMDSRFPLARSQAISSLLIKSWYSEEGRRFRRRRSKMANKRHRPKKPTAIQPENPPEAIIQMPPAIKTGDMSS